MSIDYDLAPDWTEYKFNVQFVAQWFVLTTTVVIATDDTDEALQAAAALIEDQYGFDLLNIAYINYFIERA